MVIDGEVVSEKIAEHPAFRNVARSYAKLFDMQHDPQYQEALTYTSPTTGDLVNASFLVPKTVEDLAAPPPRHLHLGRVLQRLPGPLRRLHELRAHRARHGREVVLPRRTRSSARTSATTTSGPGKTTSSPPTP